MTKKLFPDYIVIAIVLLVAVSVAGCSSGSSPGAKPAAKTAAPKVIDVASSQNNSPKDTVFIFVTETDKTVGEKTNGAIKLVCKGDEQLGTETQVVEGLKMGTIDAAVCTAGSIASSVPSLGILDMPYLFTSREQAFDFVDNSPIIKQIEQDILKQYNAYALGWVYNGFRNVLNNKRPITNADDFKGLKVRVMSSPVYVKLLTLLEANPTPMAISETFTALEQGVVDGMDHPVSASYTIGSYKFCKYYDLTKHTCTLCVFLVRKDYFDSLTPQQQQIMRDAVKNAQKIQRDLQVKYEDEMLAEMGQTITVGRNVDVNSIQKKVLPMYKEFRDQLGAKLFDQTMEYLKIKLD